MRRTSLVIISLLLCIALSVPALAAGELDAFQRTANDAAAFSDVPAGSWYEAGVQAVYRRGIMTGTGAKTFAPTQTISWAQAITIAARIHAAYHEAVSHVTDETAAEERIVQVVQTGFTMDEEVLRHAKVVVAN